MAERGPAVDGAAVAAFERELGARLPDDYRDFLLAVNGGRTARSHRVFAIKKDRTNLNSLNSLNDPESSFNLARRWETSRSRYPAEVIPVGYDDGGGAVVVVVSGPRRGQVWFADGVDPRPEGSNPRVEWFDRRDVCKIADSFAEFMAGLRPLDG